MDTRFIVNFDFRNKNDDVGFCEVVEQFKFLIDKTDEVLNRNVPWYETGFSKKQAMSKVAFSDGTISAETFSKWERRYKKDFPIFIDGVWDACDDNVSCGISYRKMYLDEMNRVDVELSFVPQYPSFNFDNIVYMISCITLYFDCSYLCIDSKGYRVLGENVFPDRLSVGWMLYLPCGD